MVSSHLTVRMLWFPISQAFVCGVCMLHLMDVSIIFCQVLWFPSKIQIHSCVVNIPKLLLGVNVRLSQGWPCDRPVTCLRAILPLNIVKWDLH